MPMIHICYYQTSSQLTTTFPLCVLTDAPNHWWDLNSRGSLVPFTFIILLSGGRQREKEREGREVEKTVKKKANERDV